MAKCCPNCGTQFSFDEFGVLEECCSPSNFDGPDNDDHFEREY